MVYTLDLTGFARGESTQKLRIHPMFSNTIKTGMKRKPTTKSTISPYGESGTWICLKKGQQVLQFTPVILYVGMPVS